MQRCVSMYCDLSSLWFWNQKSSRSPPPSSGAPCPCSASWPCPRAATPTCRLWPRSSWKTSVLCSMMCRGTWRVPSPSPGPHCVFWNRHRVPYVIDGKMWLPRDGPELICTSLTSSWKWTYFGWLVNLAKGEPERDSFLPERPVSAVPGRGPSESGSCCSGDFPRKNGRLNNHLLCWSAFSWDALLWQVIHSLSSNYNQCPQMQMYL